MKIVSASIALGLAVIGLFGFAQRTAQKVSATLAPQGEKLGGQVVWQRSTEGRFVLTLLKPAEKATLRLFPSVRGLRSPRTAPRPPGPVLEKEVYLTPGLRGTYSGNVYVPANLANGMYEVEAETDGGEKTPRATVRVYDAPVKILGHLGGKTVGGELTLIASRAPANARVVVQRTQNAPFPEEYWAKYNSVGSSSSLFIPAVTKDPNGQFKLKMTLPVTMGAGKFRARIIGDTALDASDYREFSFEFPQSAPPVYTLRLDSIQCLEETNEVGDDEIYALTVFGRIKKKNEPGYAIATVKRNGPMGFEKNQKRVLNSTIIAANAPLDAYRTVWAVALLENDDDIPKGYETALQQGNWNNHLREPYNGAMLGNTIVDAILAEKEDQKYHSNNDEYLGWKKIPLTDEDLRTARTKPGPIPRSVVIEGDGGRYRLTYSVSAAPKAPG